MKGQQYAAGWNFGPEDSDAKSVEWIVKQLCNLWGKDAKYKIAADSNAPHEATFLKLDCSKSKFLLGWHPYLTIIDAIEKTAFWIKAYHENMDLRKVTLSQINEYGNE